jgi:murein DD-endopeptidase MepM/ murein hydrolase activator NlpD
MKTQLIGPTFAKKLLDAPPPNFPAGDGGGSFIQPVGGVVTSEFGNRIHPITGELRLHKGIDIGGNAGQSVVASASGTVIIAGVVSGYGNFVEIKHENGLTSAYAHLASFNVSEGESVVQGQKIGVVGATGGVTAPQNPRDFLNFA